MDTLLQKAQNVDAPVSAQKPFLLFVDSDAVILNTLSICFEGNVVTAALSRRRLKRCLTIFLIRPAPTLIGPGLPPTPQEKRFKSIRKPMPANGIIKILVPPCHVKNGFKNVLTGSFGCFFAHALDISHTGPIADYSGLIPGLA